MDHFEAIVSTYLHWQ